MDPFFQVFKLNHFCEKSNARARGAPDLMPARPGEPASRLPFTETRPRLKEGNSYSDNKNEKNTVLIVSFCSYLYEYSKKFRDCSKNASTNP
jgi:hypothetical protein